MSSRVVLDTNVLVSAYGWGGKPATLVAKAFTEEFRIVSSPALLAEFARVVQRGERFDDAAVREVVMQIVRVAVIVRPEHRLAVLVDDDDNRILECAIEGEAAMIVSGDRHLLDLGHYEGIEIVTVREALARLAVEEGHQ